MTDAIPAERAAYRTRALRRHVHPLPYDLRRRPRLADCRAGTRRLHRRSGEIA